MNFVKSSLRVLPGVLRPSGVINIESLSYNSAYSVGTRWVDTDRPYPISPKRYRRFYSSSADSLSTPVEWSDPSVDNEPTRQPKM